MAENSSSNDAILQARPAVGKIGNRAKSRLVEHRSFARRSSVVSRSFTTGGDKEPFGSPGNARMPPNRAAWLWLTFASYNALAL